MTNPPRAPPRIAPMLFLHYGGSGLKGTRPFTMTNLNSECGIECVGVAEAEVYVAEAEVYVGAGTYVSLMEI